MEFVVQETNEAGYSKPVYSFTCPMCDLAKYRDLDREYVRSETWRHLVAVHRVAQSKIDLVFFNPEAIEGLKAKTDMYAHFVCACNPWTGICGTVMSQEEYEDLMLSDEELSAKTVKCPECSRLRNGVCPVCSKNLAA